MPALVAEASPQKLRATCGEDPSLVCRELLDATGSSLLADVTDWVLGPPLKIILILVVAVVAGHLLRRLVKRGLRGLHSGALRERLGATRRFTPDALLDTAETSIRAEQRIEALTSVLRSGITFVVWLIAAFMVLGELGIDLAPLLAGAGVLGVALGFGSQSLVKDFISGLFILVEDQFGVGDIVDLDGKAVGVVEGVSLRTTRLRALDGTVWHVPNGEIRRVGNMSQHWSRALLDVEVAYDTDVEHAKTVIKRVADELWQEDKAILEEPEMWGVEQLTPNGVLLRLVIKTTPSEQWRIAREVRQRLKATLDAEGIEIPFPQQVVWNRGPGPGIPVGGGPPAPGDGADSR